MKTKAYTIHYWVSDMDYEPRLYAYRKFRDSQSDMLWTSLEDHADSYYFNEDELDFLRERGLEFDPNQDEFFNSLDWREQLLDRIPELPEGTIKWLAELPEYEVEVYDE